MSYNYYDKIPLKTSVLNRLRSIFQLPFLERALVRKIDFGLFKKLIPPEYLYQNPSWRNVSRDDIQYKLNISNAVDHAIYFGFKDSAAANFTKMFRDDFVVIDIGANIGATSLPYSRKCTKGNIYAYEPDQINYNRLVENINLNSFTNIVAINLGLGNKEEEVKLYRVSETNPGMNRILRKNADGCAYTTITIKTLDDEIFQRLKLSRIDAIKIDVEGFEANVLRGAQKVISTFKPRLFIELIDKNLKENGSSAFEVVNRLQNNYPYSVFRAFDMKKIDENMVLDNCQFDIIAI